MSSATTSEKSQSNSPTSTSSMSESHKEKPGSNASTEHNKSKDKAHVDSLKLFREAKEKTAKMSPEERAKAHAWKITNIGLHVPTMSCRRGFGTTFEAMKRTQKGKSQQSVTKTASPITAENAIGTCLKEVTKDATLICLFRFASDVNNEEVRFRGMIKWNIANQRVELSHAAAKRNDETIYISFCPEGTHETQNECFVGLEKFLEDFGDIKQWEVDNIQKIHSSFWDAAIHLWGFPVWSDPNLMSYAICRVENPLIYRVFTE
ncbi:hypothetical protein F4821DRAFT_256225 [Hypoxylon rubiginosum]|uniref:Uncharacterized protein n=1 Tax=Hypoxylon rubiginosum TaxID=110542 RepID=A0ACC0DBF4_9PEZI|nr:hypothetical protein F4821DRAFT_256225 [Hypoxylon rubiginosum]